MLQFIKGNDVLEYRALLEKTHDFDESLFLDTLNNRLYFNGEPLDVRIEVVTELGEDYIPKKTYKFINNEGQATVITDALIPDIVDRTVVLYDDEGQEFDYSNGLFSVKDKFLLETMASVLGFKIEYVFLASFIPVQDRDTQDNPQPRIIPVYLDNECKLVYDYDSYERPNYVRQGDSYVQEGTEIVPAGTAEVPADADVKVKSMSISRQASDVDLMFDGSSVAPGSSMIAHHGGIPAGTTVEDLESKTISEVLCNILFEDARPTLDTSTSLTIKFKESSIYHGYVEVGTEYPTFEDFDYEFTPETWSWKSADNPESHGEPQQLVEMTGIKYYLIDNEHPWTPGHGPFNPDWNIYDLESDEYLEHWSEHQIADGDKCVYYGVAEYAAIANAVDSNGSETYVEHGETKYYKQAEDGSVRSTNDIHLSNVDADGNPIIVTEFDVIAGWKIFANTTKTSVESLWHEKDTEPNNGEYEGAELVETTGRFANDTPAIYMQWPSATTSEQPFYVYIPDSYQIDRVGAANDTSEDDWSIDIEATVVDDNFQIENSKHVFGKYKKYMLDKCSGITTVKIELSKVNG